MEFKRANDITEFTFSSDELLKALFPNHQDLTLAPNSSYSLTVSVLGISEKEYRQMEWKKKFQEYVNTGKRKLTTFDISKEALQSLMSVGASTVEQAIIVNDLPKIMRRANFSEAVISEIRGFAKVWNEGVNVLVCQRESMVHQEADS